MAWHPYQFSLGYWDGDFADSFNLRSNVIPIRRLLQHRMSDPRAIKPSINKMAAQSIDEAFATGFYAALKEAGVKDEQAEQLIKQAQAILGDDCHEALVKHAAGFGAAAGRSLRDLAGAAALPGAGALAGGTLGNVASGGDTGATAFGALLGGAAGGAGRAIHSMRPGMNVPRGAGWGGRLQGLQSRFDQLRQNPNAREVGAGLADAAAMGGTGAALDATAGMAGYDTGGLGTTLGLGAAGLNAGRRRLGRMTADPLERQLANQLPMGESFDDLMTRPSNFASGMAQGTMTPGIGNRIRGQVPGSSFVDPRSGIGAPSRVAQGLERVGQMAPGAAAAGAGVVGGSGLLADAHASRIMKENGVDPETVKQTASLMQQAGETVDNIANWAKETLGPYLLQYLGIDLNQYNAMETLALLFGGGMLLGTGMTAIPMMMSGNPGMQGAGMGLGALGALAGGSALAYGNNVFPGVSSR